MLCLILQAITQKRYTMRKHTALAAIIVMLLMPLSQVLADTAKYLIPLYKISALGPPIQYDSASIGNADISVTKSSFTAQVKLSLRGGLPNTKYQSGFGVKVGSKWVVTKSDMTTDSKGAGSVTLTMNIPEKASKPYTVVVVLAASGSYIASKRVALMSAP